MRTLPMPKFAARCPVCGGLFTKDRDGRFERHVVEVRAGFCGTRPVKCRGSALTPSEAKHVAQKRGAK